MLTSTLPTIGSLTFTNSSSNYGMASGNFSGSLTNASPSAYYTIEIDTNYDQLADVSGSSFMDRFQVYGSLPIGTTSLTARVSEYDMATGQFLSSPWQTFAVSDGVVANTLPVVTGLQLTNPSVSMGTVTGDFTGVLTDTTAAMYYTVEIDATGDQLADASGMVGPGGFTLRGTVPEGTTAITVRVQEYVEATGQYEFSPWQSFTITGAESSPPTGGTTGTTETTVGGPTTTTTTETGSESGTASDTSTSAESTTSTTTSSTWTMANGTVLDTSAADAAFTQAVISAAVTYQQTLNTQSQTRLDRDLAAWDRYVAAMAIADTCVADLDADAAWTYLGATLQADDDLAAADAQTWSDYYNQVGGFEDIFNDAVDGAYLGYLLALLGFDNTQNTDNQASLDRFQTLVATADTAHATASSSAGASARPMLDAAYLAYENAIQAASLALSNATSSGSGSMPTGTGAPLDTTNDSQYQSDLTAAAAALASALASAEATYDATYFSALSTYLGDADDANDTYQSSLATHKTTYDAAVLQAVVDYLVEVIDHAATATSSIAIAAGVRDAALATAQSVYDGAVAIADQVRATARTTHEADYARDEQAAWDWLRFDLLMIGIDYNDAVSQATTIGTAGLETAWSSFDAIMSNPQSSPTDKDNALAQRLTDVTAALVQYNNSLAAAEATKANDTVDAWALYDTLVNGYISTYWNDEASSDGTRTESVNAALVIWGDSMSAAWTVYGVSDARASAGQAIADAQAATDAWYLIHSAGVTRYVDDAVAANKLSDDLTTAEATFWTTVTPAWVVYEDAKTTAATAHSVSVRNADARAVSRWAAAEGGAYSAYEAATEAARAARDVADFEWYNVFMKDMHAADAAWVLSVIPAWSVYSDEVSDHAEAWMASAAPAWKDYQNAVADADEEYTTGVAPLSIPLAEDLGANYEQWVSDKTSAEQAYGNTLAANHITWTADATAAGEVWVNGTITSWVTHEHAVNGAKVTQLGSIGTAVTNWAGTVAGQYRGVSSTATTDNTFFTITSESENPDGTVILGIDVDGDGLADLHITNSDLGYSGSISGPLEQLAGVIRNLESIVELNRRIDYLIAERTRLRNELQAAVDLLETLEQQGFASEYTDPQRNHVITLQVQLELVIQQLSVVQGQLKELETNLGAGGVIFQGYAWQRFGGYSKSTGLRNLDKVFQTALDKSPENHGIYDVTLQDASTMLLISAMARAGAALATRLASRTAESVASSAGAIGLTAAQRTINAAYQNILKSRQALSHLRAMEAKLYNELVAITGGATVAGAAGMGGQAQYLQARLKSISEAITAQEESVRAAWTTIDLLLPGK